MTYLLDANICIAAFRGNGDVRRAIDGHHPDDIYICSPVVAELYVGAYKSNQRRKNVLLIEELLRDYDCLQFTTRESLKFADVFTDMVARGASITVFDLQIAAIALTHGMTVVTHDIGDFSRIPGLLTEDWLVPAANP